jgi:hypothetical protein
MKKTILALFLTACSAVAGEMVTGKVSFIASGSVYLSLGRDQGIEDSTRVYVIRQQDTISVLQVFAVSSKSSVCRILSTHKEIQIGDVIIASLPERAMVQPAAQRFDSTAEVPIDTSLTKNISVESRTKKKGLNLRGRIGFQYYSTQFDDSRLNIQQPGLLFSIGGDLTDVPIKFDMYGTLRMTGRNNAAPFSSRASNDSRLYRFSLEYDDRILMIGAGRILPTYASPSGYIDGVSLARHMGKFIAGVALGFQPDPSLQLPSSSTKKFLVFGQYEGMGLWNTTAGAAYTRAWTQRGTEREALSAYLSMFSLSGFSLYASSDIDLKVLRSGEEKYSPVLSLLVCSANYRVSDIVTGGISVDASRPVYSLTSNKTIPDSLLDKELRSGVSFNLNFSLWRGSGLYTVYTTRLEGTGFGRYFSNSSTLFYNNIVRTGINLRFNYLVNQNSYTHTHGFGINVQRNVFGMDIGFRFQQNRLDILRIQTINTTTTVGADMSVFLSNRLTLMASFDSLRGFGSSSRSLYLETSMRF